MITSDSHMHTRFSTDSDADIRDMIESALKKGLQSICITDHIDKDYHCVPRWLWNRLTADWPCGGDWCLPLPQGSAFLFRAQEAGCWPAVWRILWLILCRACCPRLFWQIRKTCCSDRPCPAAACAESCRTRWKTCCLFKALFKFTVDREKYAPLTAGGARASGGQGYVQHCSMTEPCLLGHGTDLFTE